MSSLTDEEVVKMVEKLIYTDILKLHDFFYIKPYKITSLYDWDKRENILHLLVRSIHKIIQSNNTQIVQKFHNAKFLITIAISACKRKGNPNEILIMVNKDGQTPYDLAKELEPPKSFPQFDFYEMFLKQLFYEAPAPAIDNEYRDAIQKKDIEKALSLIEAGASVNIQDSDGNTMLLYACKKNDPNMVKYLLDKGADPNITNKDNQFSLMFSIINDNNEIFDLLLSKKVNVNFQDIEGVTPLMYASYKNNVQFVKGLLIAGANIKVESKENKEASEYTDHVEIRKLLYYAWLKLPIENLGQIFSQKVNSAYKYPTVYTSKIPFTNVIRVPIENASHFYDLLFRCTDDDVCDFCEHLEQATDKRFDPLNYGFIYRNDKTDEVYGFTVFEILNFDNDIFENKNKNKYKNNKINTELDVPYGSIISSGILRCSDVKGLGIVIQSDIEDFARINSMPLTRLQAADINLKNKYYKPKFGYVEHSRNNTFLYKKIKGGKRKTRKSKKSNRNTQRKIR
jgi:hypothetical protein